MDRALLAGVGFKELKNQITDARQALTHYSEAIVAGMPEDAAQAAVLADLALQYQEVAATADEATAAEDATSASSIGAAGGFAGMAVAVLAVVTAIQILLPPVYLLISALAVVTSFAVAGAGMVALLGAIGVAIGGLGAGVLALGIAGMGGTGAAAALATATANLKKAEAAVANAGGPSISQASQNRLANAQRALAQWNALHQGTLTQAQQFTQQNLEARVAQAQQGMTSKGGATQTQLQNLAAAQAAYNAALAATQTPISIFMAKLDEMKTDFEKAAKPIAAEIINWAAKGLPAIEKLGMGIMQWFGQRVPGILRQISQIIKDLAPDFQNFGKFLGDLFDRNEGKIAPMAEAFVKFGLSLTTGLLSTLEQLSNWFLQRLPTYGPVVKSILGGAGKVVGDLVGAFGKFADYVVKNWPGWVKQITDAWNTKDAKDIRDRLPGEIDSIRQSFEDIIKQAPVWVPQVLALANAMVAIAAAVASITSNLEKLVGFVNGNPIAKAVLTGGASLINISNGPGGGSTGAPSGRPGVGGRQSPITIHVNGAKNPQATAVAVASHLRRITQV